MRDIQLDISKEEFCDLAKNSRPVIIQVRERTAVNCTPFQLYSAMKDDKGGACRYSYLLESVEKEQRHARFSFVGCNPEAVVTVKNRVVSLDYSAPSPLIKHVKKNMAEVCHIRNDLKPLLGDIKPGFDTLDAVRAAFPANGTAILNHAGFDRQTFMGGAIGYNSYDLVYDCWLDREAAHTSEFPDAQFALISKTVVFDHLTDTVHIVLTPFISQGDDPAAIYEQAKKDTRELTALLRKAEAVHISDDKIRSGFQDPICTMEKQQYEDAVKICRQHIIDGDIFQVVLSRRYELELQHTPLELYHKLREVNPSPYMYIFEYDGTGIIGASPETLMSVYNNKVITNPIAGTCPRGSSLEEDTRLAEKMLKDEKERAEHVMLVDLGRNDVRMVCRPGTVKVEDFMSVLKYSHVQHIESTVTGLLQDDKDQFDATRAIFPAGTLSGAPKIRAMEIIDDLETAARGIYGGGVGYYSINGDADFAIVIRTVIIRDKKAYIQAGAGIVADSDPAYEYNETERKMAAMIKALGGGA